MGTWHLCRIIQRWLTKIVMGKTELKIHYFSLQECSSFFLQWRTERTNLCVVDVVSRMSSNSSDCWFLPFPDRPSSSPLGKFWRYCLLSLSGWFKVVLTGSWLVGCDYWVRQYSLIYVLMSSSYYNNNRRRDMTRFKISDRFSLTSACESFQSLGVWTVKAWSSYITRITRKPSSADQREHLCS